MKSKVLAMCLITYPDESDMHDFVAGNKQASDVRIYHKHSYYYVYESDYNQMYYKIVIPRIYEK